MLLGTWAEKIYVDPLRQKSTLLEFNAICENLLNGVENKENVARTVA
jgi:hypothetical protein